MTAQQAVDRQGRGPTVDDLRERLLAGLPVTEPALRLAATRDDPAIEQPQAFLAALRTVLDSA